MPTEDIPTLAEVQEAKRNMDTITEFIESDQDTLTDQYGDTRSTLQGVEDTANNAVADVTAQADRAVAAANQADIDADRAEAAAALASTGVIDRGAWDASTGNFPTPTLVPEERTDWYRISVAGTMSDANPDQPDVTANIGDNLYWDRAGDFWYLIDNTDSVVSVNGEIGAVLTGKVLGADGPNIIRKGTTATRPDTNSEPNQSTALFWFNETTGEYEAYNPSTEEWGSVGGGGVPPIDSVQNADFTANRNKLYGFDTSTNQQIAQTIPAGLAVNSWSGITDRTGAFTQGVVHARFVLPSGETFDFLGEDGLPATELIVDAQFATVFIRKYASNKWQIADATFGQPADYVVDKIQNGYGDWVIIGESGAPSYESGTSAFASAMGLRYRFIDANTIHVLGSVSGSFNGNVTVFSFPSEISDRITENQRSPVMGNLTGAVSNLQLYSLVSTTGAFQIVEEATTGVADGAYINHTIVLDT